MRGAVRLALTAVALTLVAPLAHASDEGAEKDAQSRFEEGLGRARNGDFDAARISFTQAYAVLRRPRILWNLALSEEKTGHVLEALGHFKSVAGDPMADEADRSGAQAHVASLFARTGHIEVRAPVGAPIRIDSGPILGTAPLADVVDVTPGHHVVEVRLAQGPSAFVVDPAAGEVAVATFIQPAAAGAGAEARSRQPPPTTDKGAAQVPGQPGADAGAGPGAGAAPGAGAGASGAAPAPGAGAGPASAPVTGAGAGPSAARIVVVSAAGGIAVGALVLGIYFGAKSSSEASTANGLRGQVGSSGCAASPPGLVDPLCGQLASAVNAENRDAGLSTGMYITAGAVAMAGAVIWFVWPRSADAKRVEARVLPVLGPGLAGASAEIAF